MKLFHRLTCSLVKFSVPLSAILVILCSTHCWAENLEFSFGDSKDANVTITSAKDIEFSSFKVNNPYRLVVDVKNLSAAPVEHFNKNAQIPKIQVNKVGSGSRIVLEPVPGTQLMTRQDSPRSITVLAFQSEPALGAAVPASSLATLKLTGTASGGGTVTANTLIIKDDTITLGTNGTVGPISTFSFPETNRFVFVIEDTNLAIKQGRYKLDFLNLTGMDVEQNGKNAKLTFHVKPRATFPNYFSAKDGKAAHIRFFVTETAAAESHSHSETKMVEGSEKPRGGSRFRGQRISLDFDNADVRHVIRLLSEVNKKNYMLTDEVKGMISLKLVNVPWDQALELILKNNNLAAVEEGNVTEIITFNQNIERIKRKLELEDFNKSQENVSICAVQLRHAAATRVSAAANTILTRGASEFSRESTAKVQAQGTLDKTVSSDPGKTDVRADGTSDAKANSKSTGFSISNIYAEPNTNRLIIRDYPSKFPEILRVLSLLDVPDQQVMIEARIIEASSDFTRSLGVQWGAHYRDGSASFAGINSLDTGFGGITNTPPSSGTSGGGIDTGISFGTLTSNVNIGMRLSAAASSGLIKIVSTPKVAVTYGETATIKDGKKQPYTTTSSNGTQTQFVDAVLSLSVKPIITPSCDVVMDLNVTNDSVGAGSPPPINQKSAVTKLTVRSGETAVIGGTFVNEETDASMGVPFLMEIPLLGNLFKSTEKAKRQRELLVFITPKLLNSVCGGSDVIKLNYEKLECSKN